MTLSKDEKEALYELIWQNIGANGQVFREKLFAGRTFSQPSIILAGGKSRLLPYVPKDVKKLPRFFHFSFLF